MDTEIDIEHTGLDGEGEGDDPETTVHLSITLPDGMRYSGVVSCEGAATVDRLAEMIGSTVAAAAAAHSPELAERVKLVRASLVWTKL
jgi:stress response protein SCP2